MTQSVASQVFATPQKTKGGQEEITVSDDQTQELLKQILIELKTMNMHFKTITDENFNEGDIS